MLSSAPKLLFLEPVFVEKIWGGRKLATEFGYDLPQGRVGECWAISAHPHGDCRVADGPYAGRTLSELWRDHRELFGNAPGDRFPLLVKILDASDNLSVQVHPGDAYAAAHEGGSLGKRECWYVLDANAGAHIIVGQHARDRAEFLRMVHAGAWEDLLNEIPVHTGDFFAVEPGTVHAILAGTLILETQQSSDVTYRVYDFDRVDDSGQSRELHIEQSADVVDYAAEPPVSGELTAPEVDGITHMLHNESFDVLRVRVREGAPVDLEQRWDYLCVSVVAGAGALVVDGAVCDLAKGDHFIALAGAGTLRFIGEMELVCSYVSRDK